MSSGAAPKGSDCRRVTAPGAACGPAASRVTIEGDERLFAAEQPPVLLLAYNRPMHTRRVLTALKSYGVEHLYVAVDGPRVDVPGDFEAVALVWRQVAEIYGENAVTRHRANNLGLRVAVVDALDWFFSMVEAGVVLEDDCLPGQFFLPFAGRMLDRYRNVAQVGMIAGTNLLGNYSRDTHFLADGHVWGWATWRDRWQGTPRNLATRTKATDKAASAYYGWAWPYRRRLLEGVASGRLKSWAIPWLYWLAVDGKWAIVPGGNLVENTGHDLGGTHTKGRSVFSSLSVRPLPPDCNRKQLARVRRGYQHRVAVWLLVESCVFWVVQFSKARLTPILTWGAKRHGVT